MFNVKEFKSHFDGESTLAMIDYAMENETFFIEDLANVAIISRMKNKRKINRRLIKRKIRFLTKIGFIEPYEDQYRVNPDFVPLSQ
jgi:hypothetical protein